MEYILEKTNNKGKYSRKVMKSNDIKKTINTAKLCFNCKLCKTIKLTDSMTNEVLLDLK